MDDRPIDDALMTATNRARQAEEQLIGTPIESPEIVTEAHKVERRAEDVEALARDAAEAADS